MAKDEWAISVDSYDFQTTLKSDGIYEVTVKRIRELCEEREVTPNGLSYISGVSQSTIKSILNGESKNPGIVTIKKICDGFNITIAEFFNTEDFNKLEQELE